MSMQWTILNGYYGVQVGVLLESIEICSESYFKKWPVFLHILNNSYMAF